MTTYSTSLRSIRNKILSLAAVTFILIPMILQAAAQVGDYAIINNTDEAFTLTLNSENCWVNSYNGQTPDYGPFTIPAQSTIFFAGYVNNSYTCMNDNGDISFLIGKVGIFNATINQDGVIQNKGTIVFGNITFTAYDGNKATYVFSGNA